MKELIILKRQLFILFLLPCFLFAQNRTIDSLKLALKNAKHDTMRCNILSILAETASDEEWPAFNEQLKQLAEENIINKTKPKNFYLKHLADAMNNIGYLANQKGEIPKALEYYHKSLKIEEEIGDKEGIASSYNNMGFIYYRQGDIPKALEYHHESLKIREMIGDKEGIANSLNNIGLVYHNQGSIPKALEYYAKSLNILDEIGDKYGMANSLNNIGLVYYYKGDIPKALEYYHKSLKIMEKIGDKHGIAQPLNNLGVLYDKQGDIPKALDYYNKSLKIRQEIGNKEGIAESLNNIARLTLTNGQIKEALVFANKGMQTAKELGFPEYIRRSAGTIKTIFKKQNKYKEAFEMYELEIKMKDSINNEETQKAAVKKQMQYQYETQARELKNEQDKKDIIAKAELNQREKERNYFVVGFALVIVPALFILRSYRQKQKANVIISQQKHEVEESRKEILDSIHYAQRIQRAHLPTPNYIAKNLNRLQNQG